MINPQENNINTTNWIKKLSSFLLCTLTILISTPYSGIWHDSVLYLGQALLRINPEVFQKDLFFAYGSQASFTLFPQVLAWLINKFDTGSVFLILSLLARFFFAIASWILLKQLLPKKFQIIGLLALFFLPAYYGAHSAVRYAEPFLTGRSYAEPLALLALAAMLKDRLWLALTLWMLSALIHPLMAIPALAVMWFWLTQENKRWIHALWLIPIIAISSLFSIENSNFIFQSYDDEWFRQVWGRNLIVFYSNSQYGDWLYLLLDFFILIILIQKTSGIFQRLVKAIFSSGLLLFTIGLIFSDGLHLVLPSGLQLWRVHWLMHWTAMACFPWLIWKHWQAHPSYSYLVIFCAVILSGIRPSMVGAEIPGLIVLYFLWPWIQKHTNSFSQNGIIAFVIIPVLLNTWMYYSLSFAFIAITKYTIYFAFKLTFLCFIVTWIFLNFKKTNKFQDIFFLLLLIGMLIPAQKLWDQRFEKEKLYEKNFSSEDIFGFKLENDAQVLWIGELLPTWQILGRASYMSDQQMAGVVFNKETSKNVFLRKELLHVKKANGDNCAMVISPMDKNSICSPDHFAIKSACIKAKGELDYIVTTSKIDNYYRGIWSESKNPMGDIYIYACNDFLSLNESQKYQ